MAPFHTPVFRGLVPFGLFSFLFSSVAYTRRPIGTGRISSTPCPARLDHFSFVAVETPHNRPLRRAQLYFPRPDSLDRGPSPYCLSRRSLLPPHSVVQPQVHLNLKLHFKIT